MANTHRSIQLYDHDLSHLQESDHTVRVGDSFLIHHHGWVKTSIFDHSANHIDKGVYVGEGWGIEGNCIICGTKIEHGDNIVTLYTPVATIHQTCVQTAIVDNENYAPELDSDIDPNSVREQIVKENEEALKRQRLG